MSESSRLTPPDSAGAAPFTSPAKQSPSELLAQSQHRPFALPDVRPWIMAQTWQRLLFAHYAVPAEMLRPLIPDALEIDTYDSRAWVGVVPFLMTGVRLRGLPPVPGTATFPELNVRTYVRYGERAGVWFFSLEAANPLAVWAARRFFNLPYYHAEMSMSYDGDRTTYRSRRTHTGAPDAIYDAMYAPTGPVQDYPPQSLTRWFTERYALYARASDGRIIIGHITHRPWPLQPAELTLREDTMAEAAGITLPDTEPLLHYAHHLDILAWPVQTAQSL